MSNTYQVNESAASHAWDREEPYHVVVMFGDEYHADSSHLVAELADERAAFLRLAGALPLVLDRHRCQFVEGFNVRDLVSKAMAEAAES